MRSQRSAESGRYAEGPRAGELVAVIAAGTAHVLTELLLSETVAFGVSAAVSVAFLGYLAWRVRVTPGVVRAWGMRGDNFSEALRAHLPFVAAGAAALLMFGEASGSFGLPATFWLTLALYPMWGAAQQFALQNLIARNLSGLTSSALGVATVAAALFGASHYPRLDLVVLTLIAGVPLTLIYRRCPNLWAVGIAHGVLGSLAAYLVLGEDPGAVILSWFGG